MALPTDRGYVAITELGGGLKRVDVYARRTAAGPSNLFASHSGLSDVVVHAHTPFATRARGRTRVSTDVVEVFFNEEENRLYVRDPAQSPTLLR